MAATIWDTSVRASIADRAQRVSADAKPGWGKMNPGLPMPKGAPTAPELVGMGHAFVNGWLRRTRREQYLSRLDA